MTRPRRRRRPLTVRERLAWIVTAALRRDRITAPLVAKASGSNVRSVYRDLAALRRLLVWDRKRLSFRLRPVAEIRGSRPA